jgi:hypothetical protein
MEPFILGLKVLTFPFLLFIFTSWFACECFRVFLGEGGDETNEDFWKAFSFPLDGYNVPADNAIYSPH